MIVALFSSCPEQPTSEGRGPGRSHLWQICTRTGFRFPLALPCLPSSSSSASSMAACLHNKGGDLGGQRMAAGGK